MAHLPDTFEIDIDRVAVTRYWRFQSIVLLVVVFGFLGCLIGIGVGNVDHGAPSMAEYIGAMFRGGLIGLGGGTGVAVVLYALLAHFPVRRHARNLVLRVDGPFLCIRTGGWFVTDRRVHFRAIADYATSDGPILRLCGIKLLSFRGEGLRPNNTPGIGLGIPGVIDPDATRDLLAAVDADREWTHSPRRDGECGEQRHR